MDLWGRTSKWLTKLSADERHVATRKDFPQIFRGRGAPSTNVISESGLSKLIMRSDKPEAVAFQDWVTREVLPAIRKTGGYMLAGADKEAIHEEDKAMHA
jgi:prophage antirepressor-like protein